MATPTSAALPPVKTVTRISLVPDFARSLPQRQLVWAGSLAAIMGIGSLLGAVPAGMDALLGLGLGLGVLLTSGSQKLRGLGALVALPVITVGAGAVFGTSSLLASLGLQDALPGYLGGIGGWQILAAGAAAGLAVSAVGLPSMDRAQAVMGLLAGVALCGLGWWVSQRLVPMAPSAPHWAAAQGGVLGLVTGQLLLLPGLRSHSAHRIPSPSKVRATLEEDYRAPVMDAWKIDQHVAKEAPDAETRDGLGEVAAWVYKLQWTLQALDQQVGGHDEMSLQERVTRTYDEAEDASDPFVRERRLATARHLEQLQEHYGELSRERRRTEALRQYASVFLEEARAGLALARVSPGSHTPERLEDVLGRLRSYSEERGAHRRTAHEVVKLA